MKRLFSQTSFNGKALRPLLALTFGLVLRANTLAATEDLKTPNLASPNSAEIEYTTPDGRVELVRPDSATTGSTVSLNDETLSCPLQQGHTTFVIKLPSTALLDRFTFVNENATAAGELKISVSNYQLPATSSKWVDVDGSVTFSRKRLFNLSMVGVEARYVKLSFNVESGGRIADLGLYAGRTLDHSAWKNAGNQQLSWLSKGKSSRQRPTKEEFDYARLTEKARVVYISSGKMEPAHQMIDENNETAFAFASDDSHPTTIVELAANEEIHRVTARYKSRTPGRLDVYLLDDIGKSSTDLNYRTPNASVTDDKGEGESSVEFDPEGARFVAVRFTPADASATGQPFEIIEINAFGGMPTGSHANEAPDLYATNYNAAPFPGQNSTDISSKLGTLAIPPTLNVVSP